MKTPIRACLRCGDRNLDFTPGDGMMAHTYFGIGPVAGIAICKNCGRRGGPIEFDKEEDYGAFLKHLKTMKQEPRKKIKEGYKKR